MAQRGFIFAVHPTHGLLLLRAYKKKKGVHHQLPGGRVDAEELRAAGLRAIAAREFQHCDDMDAQIQRIEIEIQRLAGERDAHDARARRAVGDAARLEGR